MEKLISVGKILNFHGILGVAKIGYSNASVIENLKKIIILKNGVEFQFNVETVKFHKNCALVKFKEINSINELIEYKGFNIYIKKDSVQENLKDNEFLVEDLVGLNVYDDKDDFVGVVEDVRTSGGNDILCIKHPDCIKTFMVPFVEEIVPIVNIKDKKIILKPIEGLIEKAE